MRKIKVSSKDQIKELLYDGFVLGVKDDRYRSFGGFQRWFYDREHNVCRSCATDWTDLKRIENYSLNKAAKRLWHNHKSLFVYTKNIPPEKQHKIQMLVDVG